MKLVAVLATGLMLTTGTASYVHADSLGVSNFVRSVTGKAKRSSNSKNAIGKIVAPAIIGAVGGAAVGAAVGGKNAAAAGAVIGAVTTVGVLMALENEQRQNVGQGGGQGTAKSADSGSKAKPPAPLSERELQRETWRRIQQRLNELGFDAGRADGRPGPRTRAAVESFQASVGHDMTGELTPEQTALLYADASDVTGIEEPDLISTSVEVDQAQPTEAAADEPLRDLAVNPEAIADEAVRDSAVSAPIAPGVPARRATAPDSTVMGIRPLTELGEAETSLQGIYDSCQRSGSTLVCTSSRVGGVSDTLVVGYAQEGSREVIHTLSRELKFEHPVPRADIVGQLSGPYPDLIFVPQMTLASTRDCVSRATSFRESRFEELLEWARSGAIATSNISALAEACDFYYSIDVPEGDQLQSVSITLFTGGPIRQALATSPVGDSGTPQIRF